MKDKSIVIVNPNRYIGYSYILYAINFLKEYSLIGIWTSNNAELYSTILVDKLDRKFIAKDYEFEELILELKKLNPKCFVVGDDTGFLLADKLQSYFFPDRSNDQSKYEIRSNKNNYLEYLYKKNLSSTKQQHVTKNQIPEIKTLHVMKPSTGGGNINVFFVQSKNQIEKILNDVDEDFILQEAVTGEEYCIEICSFNGVHKCTMASKYKGNYLVNNLNPWREENELVSQHDNNVKIIYEYVIEILNTLGIKIGLTWTQVKISDKTPQIIEINFRSQGHGLINLIHNATGCNYVSESLKAYLTPEKFDTTKLMYTKIGNFNKISVNNKKERYLENINWQEIQEIKSVKYIHQYIKLPNFLSLTTNLKNSLGMILLENCNNDKYQKDYELITNWKLKIEK
jgi:predicted ATP-grasp superfamily ATP-dependent carboligase